MVRAVMRALAILDEFDRASPMLSLQEISERIGMAKATTFRLVNTLERAGFLIRFPDQRYGLSLKLVRLASLVRGTLSIRDVARQTMIEVNRVSGETITLNVVSGKERVCIEVVDTPAPLMSFISPGEHVPLLYGATGRILLAFLPPNNREEVLDQMPDERERAIVDKEIGRFRHQGYALTRGQRVPGITAIAVPIFDSSGEALHCLALTGPSVRVDLRDSEFIELMLAASQEISGRLGAAPSETIARVNNASESDVAASGEISGSTEKPTLKKGATRKAKAAAT
ncbi:MAG: IclR family transcriptional regulator [Pigmentiphaga sp.]